jgi:hypothetical protein
LFKQNTVYSFAAGAAAAGSEAAGAAAGAATTGAASTAAGASCLPQAAKVRVNKTAIRAERIICIFFQKVS